MIYLNLQGHTLSLSENKEEYELINHAYECILNESELFPLTIIENKTCSFSLFEICRVNGGSIFMHKDRNISSLVLQTIFSLIRDSGNYLEIKEIGHIHYSRSNYSISPVRVIPQE